LNYLKTLRDLSRLIKQAKMPRGQVKAMQEQKLRSMLEYAWEHSAYYRRTFEKAGINRDELQTRALSDFPTMDKTVLMEHFDELVTVPDLRQEDLRKFDAEEQTGRKPYLGKYHVVHSSGSTGKPGYFVYDEAAWNQMLSGILRGALWNMSMPQILKLLAGRPRILYIAATDGRYGGAMAVGDGIDGVSAKQMFLDINTPLAQWTDSVREFRPNLVIGYPSAIKILAELAGAGQIHIELKRVISCGEPLPSGLRTFLEDAFSAPVINFYGASESLALGVEMGKSGGMLLFDDLNVIEITDGAIYLTCLYNFAQPLIRYKISDHLTVKEPTTECPFTHVEILLGRAEDILWFENKEGHRDFLHPLAVEGFCVDGLRDYQFCQTRPDSFEMLCEVKAEQHDHVKREMLRRMKNILSEKHLDYVHFDVRFADNIQPDFRTGKKPLIIPMQKNGMEAAL